MCVPGDKLHQYILDALDCPGMPYSHGGTFVYAIEIAVRRIIDDVSYFYDHPPPSSRIPPKLGFD